MQKIKHQKESWKDVTIRFIKLCSGAKKRGDKEKEKSIKQFVDRYPSLRL